VAIKGKSRKRSRPKAPPRPPRPAIGARKTPLAFRRDVKRAVVIVLAIASLLGGLRVWQNVSRADALKLFNRKLAQAQTSFIQHFAPDAPASFDKNIQAFTAGQIGGGVMIALATLWEKDFRATEDKVAKLKAPNKVAEDARVLIMQGIDGYVGVVRLFNLAGQVSQIAAVEKDPKQKLLLNDKVKVLMQHADEWRKQRADKIYTLGAQKLSELNIEYGIEKPQSTQQQQQQQQQ
jgi:hypothetical protein